METKKLLPVMAEKYMIAPDKMINVLTSTVFKGVKASIEQMQAFLIIANQYELNPFTNEIHAFTDKYGGVITIVGVDGWIQIACRNPLYDGIDYSYADKLITVDGTCAPEWIEAKVYFKGRERPVTVREYFVEVFRKSSPWKTHPRRMLRHKATVQALRMAFGLSGIYDPDEAERIKESQQVHTVYENGKQYASKTEAVTALIKGENNAVQEVKLPIEANEKEVLNHEQMASYEQEPKTNFFGG